MTAGAASTPCGKRGRTSPRIGYHVCHVWDLVVGLITSKRRSFVTSGRAKAILVSVAQPDHVQFCRGTDCPQILELASKVIYLFPRMRPRKIMRSSKSFRSELNRISTNGNRKYVFGYLVDLCLDSLVGGIVLLRFEF